MYGTCTAQTKLSSAAPFDAACGIAQDDVRRTQLVRREPPKVREDVTWVARSYAVATHSRAMTPEGSNQPPCSVV